MINKTKYKELIKFFQENNGMLGWYDIPDNFKGLLDEACSDGVVNVSIDYDTYFLAE